jgi:hypothetical protein
MQGWGIERIPRWRNDCVWLDRLYSISGKPVRSSRPVPNGHRKEQHNPSNRTNSVNPLKSAPIVEFAHDQILINLKGLKQCINLLAPKAGQRREAVS